MNRFFFRDLLESHPKLLERMLAFNCAEKKDAALPTGGIWDAVQRQPDLVRILTARQRLKAVPVDAYWAFTDESQRLAFYPAAVLERVGRLVSASAYAEDIARTLSKTDVLAFKDFLGEDIYSYALTRGRYQVGSLRQALISDSSDASLSDKCRLLARRSLATIRAGWPAELQRRTDLLFAAADLPAAPPLDPALRQPLWHFMKKLILRELDNEWIRYFD